MNGNKYSKHCTDGFYGLQCRKKWPLKCYKTCDTAFGLCTDISLGNNNSEISESIVIHILFKLKYRLNTCMDVEIIRLR